MLPSTIEDRGGEGTANYTARRCRTSSGNAGGRAPTTRRQTAATLSLSGGEEPKATAPTSTQTLIFGSENKVLTLKLARRKVEAHGLALILEKGLKASIRRACSAKLQMPKASETTSDLNVVATVENIPRTFLVTWLQSLGWTVSPETSAHAELVTDYPKTIGEAMQFQLLPSQIGFGCLKLYKPQHEPKGKAVLGCIPPARAVHRVRDDGSEILEMVMNIGIINEVCTVETPLRTPPGLPSGPRL